MRSGLEEGRQETGPVPRDLMEASGPQQQRPGLATRPEKGAALGRTLEGKGKPNPTRPETYISILNVHSPSMRSVKLFPLDRQEN